MTRDILDEPGPARFAESYPSVGAAIGLAVLHRSTGLRGRIDKFTGDIVQIRDPAGREHRFRNRPGAFAVAGETVTLDLVDVTYELTVYEATPGEEVGSETLEAASTDCPSFVFVDEGQTEYYNSPDETDYTNALKPYVDA